MSKLMDLSAAVAMVQDGDTVAFGGNVLYRSPVGAVKELIRQGRKELHLVKTAIAYEADLLCAAGAVKAVTAGFVGYEGEFGLCRWYRKGVESGAVRAYENACYSVITALRGAIYGVPFLPIRGMKGSDLLDAVGFKSVTCPYTGEELVAIQAIAPDVAFLHVQEADEDGNACIIGPSYEDMTIARAAKKLVLTAEEIVPGSYFAEDPHRADIPAVVTTAVVHLPGGARPCAVSGCYDVDREELRAFLDGKTPEAALAAAGIEGGKH
ncbi:CoA transferase subunit A [Lawsonibacter celer]|uniref:CoA transferase subunit A n=1 Tax=Lawsonibacter celer TaxID=2986526 RepID=UPI001646A844|nr:CoA transferase subunit A [Lawsonibacter celer]